MNSRIVRCLAAAVGLLVLGGLACDTGPAISYHCTAHCVNAIGTPFDSSSTLDTDATSQSAAESTCNDAFTNDPNLANACIGGEFQSCSCRPADSANARLFETLAPGMTAAAESDADAGCNY